ncbi:ABC transporter ATP-binding protein [Corynebacterium maris]|uniref:ABC transporter ATP-binding protein n=1 Tax=Corynebacterium maris TaxID=575200 RepID=UPI00146D1F2E|nr:ABC transporter ATP-binding protein [Corynebacterium maris]
MVARSLGKTFSLTPEGEEVGFTPRRKRIVVEALKPVSFAVSAGESIGIIGQNGSGKSTLLSLIAGSESQSTGSILVSSQPTLLSVSAALQQHLTGLQNVRLGLLAKGLSLSEAKNIELEVAQWADIGDAIHRPMKTYSSGMGARLRFAIATAVPPKVLLVDEALATGDAAFNARARSRMNSFLDNAATVFLASHSINEVRNQCKRVLWLHEGELIADGPTDQVTRFYRKWTTLSSEGDRKTAAQMIRRMKRDFVPKQIILDSEAAKMLDDTGPAGSS